MDDSDNEPDARLVLHYDFIQTSKLLKQQQQLKLKECTQIQNMLETFIYHYAHFFTGQNKGFSFDENDVCKNVHCDEDGLDISLNVYDTADMPTRVELKALVTACNKWHNMHDFRDAKVKLRTVKIKEVVVTVLMEE